MKKETKRSMMLIVFGVVLFAALMNLSGVLSFLKNVFNLLLPILAGLLIAFILNVPMKGFEKLITRLCRKWKRPPKGKLLQGISFFLTLVCIALIILLVCTLVIPQMISSIQSIIAMIRGKLPQIAAFLAKYNIDSSLLSQWLEGIEFSQLIEKVTGSAGFLISSVAGVAASTLSGVGIGLIAVVVAVYALMSKAELARQSQKLIHAHLKPKTAQRVIHISTLVRDTYSKFLSGQCVEAVILGVLIFITFSLCRLPYAGLIAVLTSILSLIPYVGAFAACFIGAFLTLISNPSQALICIIVFLVVQFVEGQFIYPHVVGNSVGLSPLWTLLAALAGGSLLGLFGMIFFIPLVSVIASLVREVTDRKLQEKKAEPPTPS